MSGGRFNYIDSELMNDLFGWNHADKYTTSLGNPMEDVELSELVFDVLQLIHELDWYLCGDSGEDKYNTAKKKFKNKWFKQDRNKRLEKLIDARLNEVKKELKEIIL